MLSLSLIVVIVYLYSFSQLLNLSICQTRRGGGTSIYGLHRYVPRNRVWFLRFSVLKKGIFFDPFVTVFLVWSLDRVAKLYYLILECENARLYECFCFCNRGLIALNMVSFFAFGPQKGYQFSLS